MGIASRLLDTDEGRTDILIFEGQIRQAVKRRTLKCGLFGVRRLPLAGAFLGELRDCDVKMWGMSAACEQFHSLSPW